MLSKRKPGADVPGFESCDIFPAPRKILAKSANRIPSTMFEAILSAGSPSLAACAGALATAVALKSRPLCLTRSLRKVQRNLGKHRRCLSMSSRDYKNMLRDPYSRFVPRKEPISAAVVMPKFDGTLEASTYLPPDASIYPYEHKAVTEPSDSESGRTISVDEPAFRALVEIENESMDGKAILTGTDTFGCKYFADGVEEITVVDESIGVAKRGVIVHFSSESEVYCAAPKLYDDLLSNNQLQPRCSIATNGSSPNHVLIKGGHLYEVDHGSVTSRRSQKKRSASQKQVMDGYSAVEAVVAMLETHGHLLDPKFAKAMLNYASIPHRSKLIKTLRRNEWLHLYGHGLTAINHMPQVKQNLGSGAKQANIDMMVLENIGQWLASAAIEQGMSEYLKIHILPLFEMMFDTDIIQHLHFHMRIGFGARSICFHQSIDPFSARLPRSQGHLATSAVATYKILNGDAPDLVIGLKKKAPRKEKFIFL